jgi:thiol:disulfide interchange protein
MRYFVEKMDHLSYAFVRGIKIIMKNRAPNKILLAIFAFLAFFAFSQSIMAQESGSDNVKIELIGQFQTARAGDKIHIALVQKIAPDWHTYWRNPGDVGDKTRIKWTLPDGFKVGDIKWPSPSALPYEGFINYGYSKEVLFPIEVEIPIGATGPQTLKARVEWLECKDVCIPGEADAQIEINIGAENVKNENSQKIEDALTRLPKPLTGVAIIQDKGANLIIGVKSVSAARAQNAQFFPYELDAGALIDHAAPQLLETGSDGLSLSLTKSQSFPKALGANVRGVLRIDEDGQSEFVEIDAKVGEMMPNVSGKKPAAPVKIDALLRAIGFAFLGGLILNLMPCVFPILAMKVLGITKLAHSDSMHAKSYGLFYGFGVIATFTGLGALLFTLKAMGEGIGWGYQLQSPIFLLLVTLLIVLMGLNLLGLFEMGAGLQGVGAKTASQNNRLGAFANGALAVAVASPCTAPFMGAALGFAAIAPPLFGLLVFIALGIGFALPFVVLTFAPKLLAYLPKPGAWMEKVKTALSIPMFLTAAWLLWVLYRAGGLNNLLLALLAIFGLVFMVVLSKINPAKRTILLTRILFVLMLSTAVLYIAQNEQKPPQAARTSDELGAQVWSDEKVRELNKSGQIVFVNFTADWCITCKVNENSVFKNSKVKAAFKENNVAYLVADWTKKDEIIARALSSHGRIGVPLYLVYLPNKQEPIILPQLLSSSMVIKALEE